MQRFFHACNETHDNLWAFLLCLVAAVTMVAGVALGVWTVHHYRTTNDIRGILDPLERFGTGLITVAAAMFHSTNRRHSDKPKAE